MKIQVFQGTPIQQFQTLQQEGKVFTIQPVTVDGRNLVTSIRNMRIPLQPIAQVVDDNNNVRGLCFATGNGIELSAIGSGYAVTYNGRDILILRQSAEDGIGIAEIQAPPTSYAPSQSYPVEQAGYPSYSQQPYALESPPSYQQPPYRAPQAVPPPYQQPPYQGQPYPQQPVYQGGYDPAFFGAPVYPTPVPYVDYHEQQHLLHHYYGDHYPHHYGHGYGRGHHGRGLGHAIHDLMGHDEHHE